MFAIHLSIGMSLKGRYIGMGRNFSGGASGTVERSGAAKPGAEAFLDSSYAGPCVFSYVSSFSTES